MYCRLVKSPRIGVVAEEIAAQPVNIIGDEAIGEPVVEQVYVYLFINNACAFYCIVYLSTPVIRSR